jgi:hypothetical protein
MMIVGNPVSLSNFVETELQQFIPSVKPVKKNDWVDTISL